jgi:hypothetical protein
MLQAGRSRVSFLMRSLDFSINLILPTALWPWGSTQPLTEMITTKLPGYKERPARRADKLTSIFEPIDKKIWDPRRLTTLLASTTCYSDSITFFNFFSLYRWMKF